MRAHFLIRIELPRSEIAVGNVIAIHVNYSDALRIACNSAQKEYEKKYLFFHYTNDFKG